MQTDFYAANLKQWTVQVQSSADLDRRSVSDSFLESAFDDVWAIGVAECDLYINAAARFLCENANDLSIFSEKQAAVVEDVDPALSRYCKRGGSDPLADASTWPDDIRGQRPETAPWHYVDIPLGTKRRDVEKYCDPKESCVTRAIREQLANISNTGGLLGGQAEADPLKRANALRFLIHFVGDLHQPMHAVTNNDEGGNCVPAAFFDISPQLRNPQNEGYAPNLHGVWDVNILERATPGKTVEEVAAELDESFGKKIAGWEKGSANLDAWAWESYQLALKKAYGALPVRIPAEPPQTVKSCADDGHVSTRMLKLDEHLAEPYQNVAAPIVRQRLAQAGARLAMLLNQLWP